MKTTVTRTKYMQITIAVKNRNGFEWLEYIYHAAGGVGGVLAVVA